MKRLDPFAGRFSRCELMRSHESDPARSAIRRLPTSTRISGLRSRIGGSQTFSRSLSATRVWLKTQLWLWPVLAAFLLCGVAFGIRSLVEGSLRQALADDMTAILQKLHVRNRTEAALVAREGWKG